MIASNASITKFSKACRLVRILHSFQFIYLFIYFLLPTSRHDRAQRIDRIDHQILKDVSIGANSALFVIHVCIDLFTFTFAGRHDRLQRINHQILKGVSFGANSAVDDHDQGDPGDSGNFDLGAAAAH